MNRALPTYNAAEERNKLSHFTVQGFDLQGVVQAGANDGEEVENFIRMGIEHIIAFEPLTGPFELLKRYNPPAQLFRLGLHNKRGPATLLATDGDGKGGSLFKTIEAHQEVQANWPVPAELVRTEKIELIRFDEWVEEYANNLFIDLSNYDTLQLDTQGNEMEILEGMGDYLQGFKYLCIELSADPVYVGETPGAELSDWLDQRGFLRDSPITAHNDTFFIRKDIKATTDGQYKGRC